MCDIEQSQRDFKARMALKTIIPRIYRLPKVFQAVFQTEVSSANAAAIWQFLRFASCRGEKISRYYTMIMGIAQ